MLPELRMNPWRTRHPSPRLLYSILAAGYIGTSALGCVTYSNLEVEERDARAPSNDGRAPTSDAPAGDTSPPRPDIDGNFDTSTPPDTSNPDAPRDTAVETSPPVDGTLGDAGADISVDKDVTIDVVPPRPDAGTDARADVDAGLVADADVSPPDTRVDIAVPDVFDAGSRDADAAPPPPADADSGPSAPDVRDSGPPCRGTPSSNDEDSDGVVDECDNCPSIANTNQADLGEVNGGGTADGVGDACDPRPSSGGDSIYLFDGLNFTTFPAEWTNVGNGNWTASGTSVAPTSTNTGQEMNRAFPSGLGNYLAETAFTFNQITSNFSASLPFRMDATRNGLGCAVGTPDGINGQLILTEVVGGTSSGTPLIVPMNVPTTGNRYRLLAGGFGTNIYCYTGGTRIDATGTSTTGDSGFRTSASRATFEYLLIYRLGGALP
jgi:hypothetical protein